MNRQQFLILTAAACTGCQTAPQGGGGGIHASARVVDAGPVGQYAAEGVYENFREQGFFLVRKGGRLFAISAICTHRKCDLDAEPDHTFHCPCHGSTFTTEGHVTKGPAVRDLPVFAMRTEGGRVVVTVG